MKKFFGLGLLTAVTALGLVSCNIEIEDYEVVGNKIQVKVNAAFPETKSYFGDKVDGAYPSFWTGDENLFLSLNEAAAISESNIEIEKSADGKTLTAIATFTDDGTTSGTIYAASPRGTYNSSDDAACVGGFTSVNKSNHFMYVVLPWNQTPLASSCDPTAHLLAGTQSYEGGIPDEIGTTFHHVAAYGKLTITNVTGTISSVAITSSVPLAGKSVKYYYSEGNLSGADKNTITLSADNVTNGVFWFGCAPADLSEGTLSVTVTTSDSKTYTKDLAISGKNFKFTKGKVSAFSVDMAGVNADVELYSANFEADGEHRSEGANSFTEETLIYTVSGVNWSSKYTDVVNSSSSISGYSSVGRIAKKTTNSPEMIVGPISRNGNTIHSISYDEKGPAAINVSLYVSTDGESWGEAINSHSSHTSTTTETVDYLKIECPIYIKFVGTVTSTTTSNRDFAIDNVVITGKAGVQVEPEGITLDQSAITLTAGGSTQTLVATITPGDATDKSVTWTSSNGGVATVTEGVVTPVAEGTATITATTVNGHSATCEVTVNAAGSGVSWTRCTTVAEIQAGGIFIIGYEATANSGKIIPMANEGSASTSTAGFMYSGADASSGGKDTIDMSTVETTAKYEVTIISSGDGKVAIKVGENYLGNTNTNNNCKLFTADNSSNGTSLTVTVGTNDVFTFKNNKTTYHTLQYNPSSPRFAFYEDTQKDLVVYKKTTN